MDLEKIDYLALDLTVYDGFFAIYIRRHARATIVEFVRQRLNIDSILLERSAQAHGL